MTSDFLPSTPNARPAKNRSQAYSATPPETVLARWAAKFQPLPMPAGNAPYHVELESIIPGIGRAAAQAGKIVFHTVGDTGPILVDLYHAAVVKAMVKDLGGPVGEAPSFFYHLGDLVYNHGSREGYYEQFYKAYAAYNAPIFSIPGNHDADPVDESQPSLDGWVAYFMAKSPGVDPVSGDFPKPTMQLPNVYYTLNCPFVTIVGLYTNVPEHGVVGPAQQQWLINELNTAPTDKALIVCLHNPVYSFDSQHSGSPVMAQVLQTAINHSRRVPNMVLTAHVHNYQRIEKEIVGGLPTPFLVAGNGGYYQLHYVTSADGAVDELTGAKLVKSQNQKHGYVQIAVARETITGMAVTVDKVTGIVEIFDSFSYPAKAVLLQEGQLAAL